jgi:energy-coupling factor transport system permease protein
MRIGPAPAGVLLGCVAAAALLADRIAFAAALTGALLAVILRFGPPGRRRLYLFGALWSGIGVLVVWPFLTVVGSDVLWSGPTVPVLGRIDVTLEELELGLLYALRLVGAALAFGVYALLVDHDRLLASLGFARRSSFAAVLATRLVPTLERDAAGLAETVRGRGIELSGLASKATLVSPLVAGSLERALNLAESMEARGFGRPGRTRVPQPGWTWLDWTAVGAGALLVGGAAAWL